MSAPAYIIVLGNEKGGSGKTTTSMHLVVALMRAGFSVGSVDLDGRQRTLSRYLENRERWIEDNDYPLCLPEHVTLMGSALDSVSAAAKDDEDRLFSAVAELSKTNDFVVIDCPGSDVPLSRSALKLADTLITPLNDSLIDLDVVVEISPDGFQLERPGIYARLVVEQRQTRIKEGRPGVDWILLRNRLATLQSRNSRNLTGVLEELSRTIGCRIAHGISERVIFRQLFLSGLTVLDLRNPDLKFDMSMSHVAARQEMRKLLEALWLPRLSSRLDGI